MNDVHAGDRALGHVLRRFSSIYKAPEDRAEALLAAYLKPRLKALRIRKDEKKMDYYLRFMQAFSGAGWIVTRRAIARAFTDANLAAADRINEQLELAFADGMNEAAYVMARSGVEMWPVTVGIVAQLAAAKVIQLRQRRIMRGTDIKYNENRTQSAIHSAVYLGITPERLAKYVSRAMTRARQNESIAAARAYVYGASDSGAFFAGLEAQNSGIDVEKTWLSIMDMRVRPSHRHLHGTTVPMDDVFHGYHSDLRYPHDPMAHPAEIYRCRCRMVVHVAGKSPGEYSRELLPTQTSGYLKWRDKQIKKAGGELELLKLHKRLGRR